MDLDEAIGELNDFFDDGPCNIHFEAWDTIRKALSGTQPTDTKQVKACPDHIMYKTFTRYECENCGETEDRWE